MQRMTYARRQYEFSDSG